jgi:hypothetical protein
MQSQPNKNDTSNPYGMQARKGYSKVRESRGRGEVVNSGTRYISQLQKMLDTARRNNWARVVFALSALIARRGGVA